MKRTTLILTLGFAVAAAATAEAADWNNGAGGLKDYGGAAGVPVPAPVPVMESFSWYMRGDLGFAFKSQGSSSTTTSSGFTSTTNYDDNDGPFLGTLGFGRYLTQSLRWDLTGDYRGPQKAQSGTLNYQYTTITPGANVTITTPTSTLSTQSSQINTFAVSRAEEVRLANHTALFNLYYDFNRGSGFNPYVGVGAGVAIREGRVAFTEQGKCIYTTNSLDVPPGPQPCTEPDYRKAGNPSQVNFGIAGAVMAGFTYEISQGILIDTGYRLAYQGGNTTIRPAGSGDTISGGSRTDHEFRTGLRWNVW